MSRSSRGDARHWLSGLVAGLLILGAGLCRLPTPAPAAEGQTSTALSPSEGDSPATTGAAVFTRAVPDGIEDLLAIQKRVQALVPQITGCTVGISRGRAQGSGVIVSEDGYVLTAAHVCGGPDRRVTVTLSDGREVRGKTLGLYRTVDAGLLKITESGKWPHVEMGDSTKLKPGAWCIATGHPGGYKKDRAAVLRLGRVIASRKTIIQTDCPLIGGDSGGPLFDLDGKVIGINSRIGASTNWNFHVPVSHYSKNWKRLAAGEAWGGTPSRGRAVLGINGEDHEQGCKVTGVTEGFPAEEAGLQVGDVITKLDGKPVEGIVDLAERLGRMKPGDEIKLDIVRGEELIVKTVKLAERK